MKFVEANVTYSKHGDCSLGGLTSKHDTIRLLIDYTPEDLEVIKKIAVEAPDAFDRTAIVNFRKLMGQDAWYIEPLVKPEGKLGGMFGGNTAQSDDPAYIELIGKPLKVHDRFETEAEYEMYSR